MSKTKIECDLMPSIGEIRRAREIGKRGHGYTKYVWHACEDCGKQRWVAWVKQEPRKRLCPSCCHRVERSVRWAGGIRHNSQGYRSVCLHPRDFFYPMADHANYVLEHRLVMAKHIGRCLHSWETVHHKNHDRRDNRIENLVLETTNGHMQLTILERRLTKLRQENRRLKEELRQCRGRASSGVTQP